MKDTRPRYRYRLPDGGSIAVIFDHGDVPPETIAYATEKCEVVTARHDPAPEDGCRAVGVCPGGSVCPTALVNKIAYLISLKKTRGWDLLVVRHYGDATGTEVHCAYDYNVLARTGEVALALQRDGYDVRVLEPGAAAAFEWPVNP